MEGKEELEGKIRRWKGGRRRRSRIDGNCDDAKEKGNKEKN